MSAAKQGAAATCRRCYASLFTDRAITYRKIKGFDHNQVALSIGVQLMVRSDIGGSGVMFSIDTESGFDKVVLINAAWGLGENVVQGAVTPTNTRCSSRLLDKPGLKPIVEKTCGAKEIKMIYAGTEGGETKNVPTSKAERGAYVLSDEEILNLARQAKPSRSITASRWTWNGPRTARPASSTSSRPGPKRCSRASM
jgi:pyruvate,water dikinase